MNRKQRRAQAKINRQNAKKSNLDTKNLDLLNHLWNLVDDCQDHVKDVIKGLVNTVVNIEENRSLFITNAGNNKTSEQGNFAYQKGKLFCQFRPFHIGKASDCSVSTSLEIFEEFLSNDDAQIFPTLYSQGNAIFQSLGYMGKKGNIVIHPMIEPDTGNKTTFISTIAADTCKNVDLTQEVA